MIASGIVAVARQELTQRIRRGRWRWMLGIWFVVLFGLTALLRSALDVNVNSNDSLQRYRGAVMYGALMLLVLMLALLIVPAVTAQSVNGDRERGVLATLQVTSLRPSEIALGKLLASWGATLVFLALTLPLSLWCMSEGGVSLRALIVVTLVMSVLLGTVCGVSLGLSALLSRSTTSSVLSYLAVFALGLGTLIVFGLVSAIFQETRTVHQRVPVYAPATAPPGPGAEFTPPPITRYEDRTYTETRTRTDRTWWLLAPNPFVVLADAAPVRPRCRRPAGSSGIPCDDDTVDPLGAIGRSVRDLRRPPVPQGFATYNSDTPRPRGEPVWPTGLALNLAMGVGGVLVAIRRLDTPARTLPKGQRVA